MNKTEEEENGFLELINMCNTSFTNLTMSLIDIIKSIEAPNSNVVISCRQRERSQITFISKIAAHILETGYGVLDFSEARTLVEWEAEMDKIFLRVLTDNTSLLLIINFPNIMKRNELLSNNHIRNCIGILNTIYAMSKGYTFSYSMNLQKFRKATAKYTYSGNQRDLSDEQFKFMLAHKLRDQVRFILIVENHSTLLGINNENSSTIEMLSNIYEHLLYQSIQITHHTSLHFKSRNKKEKLQLQNPFAIAKHKYSKFIDRMSSICFNLCNSSMELEDLGNFLPRFNQEEIKLLILELMDQMLNKYYVKLYQKKRIAQTFMKKINLLNQEIEQAILTKEKFTKEMEELSTQNLKLDKTIEGLKDQLKYLKNFAMSIYIYISIYL